MIEMDYAQGEHDSAQKSEKPQWRQELSERLQAIRQKREAADLSQELERRGEETSSYLPPPRDSVAALIRSFAPAKFIEGPAACENLRQNR